MGLATIRKFRGYSQAELAKEMGIHLMAISRIERGLDHPYALMFRLAEFLQCEPHEIYRFDDVPFGYDEIIAVHYVAMKHIGRPCYFGNTADEVMRNAENLSNLYLADAREGAMIDSDGNEWKYVMPNRKFQADPLKRGRKPGFRFNRESVTNSSK